LAKALTLDRLAASSRLTRGYISLVERGLNVPSVAALLRVATALDVNVSEFFEPKSAAAPRYTLFRHDDGNGSSPDGSGIELLAIATGLKRKMIEPFLSVRH
jgi:transcriptional regulator with XRE-family HTH domain